LLFSFAATAEVRAAIEKKGRQAILFLKKEPKNFYPFRAASESTHLDSLLDAIDKSLLLLFFRKEVLSCLFSF